MRCGASDYKEWPADEGEEMCGAFLEFPQMYDDVGLLRCKLGAFKTAVCLLVVLLNRADIDTLLQIGPEEFSNRLFPEDGSAAHFLSERKRTERF